MKIYRKINFIVLLGMMTLFPGCADGGSNEIDAPLCIIEIIQTIKNDAVRNPPGEVWKWVVGDDIYYYITSDCCDQYNYLLNESCEVVCAPDGGITGLGDGNCPDFNGAIEKTRIWKDDRK